MMTKTTFLWLKRYHLAVILATGVVCAFLVYKFSTLPQIQLMILTIMVFFYFSWALLYHFFERDLNLEIMLEYILTALLALICIYGLLL